MTVRMISLWEGVPDADKLRQTLAKARDPTAPVMERQYALSYLTGAAKVLAGIESRRGLADYLRRQITSIKTTLYYSTTETPNGHQAHG